MAATTVPYQKVSSEDVSAWQLAKRRRSVLNRMAITLLALVILSIYLMPMGYAVINSLKTGSQASDSRAPILPSAPIQFEYEGKLYDVYSVPTDAGMQEYALVQPGRRSSQMVDTTNPEAGLIEWEGNWR